MPTVLQLPDRELTDWERGQLISQGFVALAAMGDAELKRAVAQLRDEERRERLNSKVSAG